MVVIEVKSKVCYGVTLPSLWGKVDGASPLPTRTPGRTSWYQSLTRQEERLLWASRSSPSGKTGWSAASEGPRHPCQGPPDLSLLVGTLLQRAVCWGQGALWEEAVGTFPGVGAENHPEATLIAGRAHWGILVLGSVVNRKCEVQ